MQLTITQRIIRAGDSSHGLRLDRVDVCELEQLFKTKNIETNATNVGTRCAKAVKGGMQLRLSHEDVIDLKNTLNIL